jgi:hypothetical protein
MMMTARGRVGNGLVFKSDETFFYSFFFLWYWGWRSGFVLAGQALYPLSVPPVPKSL